MRLPDLKPEHVVAIVDTREQLPYDLAPLQMQTASLPTGDYSVLGLEEVVSIERKSLDDFLMVVGSERERFEREVQRLLAYPVRALVVESSWGELEVGAWRSKVTSAAAISSALGWAARGLPVVMAGGRQRAQDYVRRILYIAARRRWREARQLVALATNEAGTTGQ